jgi:hypothetical protein
MFRHFFKQLLKLGSKEVFKDNVKSDSEEMPLTRRPSDLTMALSASSSSLASLLIDVDQSRSISVETPHEIFESADWLIENHT